MSGPLEGRRILLLEDEYFLADELAEALDRAGASVVGPFGTVQGALQALEEAGDLDLGILDVNVRGERAYPVAEALKTRGVPVLFVTGYDAQSIDPDWAGTPQCIKPFDPGWLLQELLF